MLAAIGLVAAAEQLADDLDSLLEHLEPLVGARPAVAEHVLVQVLAGADAEEEAPSEQRLGRRCGVGDDRRVQADQRAGHRGADPDPVRRLGDRAEHAPDERAVALRVDPRMDVIGDQREREAGRFGALGVLDEGVWALFFRREPVADLHEPEVPSAVSVKLTA